MSYKLNKANPERRAEILSRRDLHPGLATDPVTHFMFDRYVPGNGPNHRLGYNEGTVNRIKETKKVLREVEKQRSLMRQLGVSNDKTD